jgi:hypothetical protein
MRLIAALVLGLTVWAAAPAEAAWHQYINQEAGFGVDVPSDPTLSMATYKTGIAGTVPSTVFTTSENGVIFTVTVVDFSNRLLETASLLQEAIYIASRDLNILSDSLCRAEAGKRAVYGRRITEDRPDGARSTKVLYLTKGKLYIFQSLVPKGGDFGSPVAGRFVDSVIFNLGGPGGPGGQGGAGAAPN